MEMMVKPDTAWLDHSISSVEKWVEKKNYRAYEPFDGQSSFFYPLTMGNQFLERVLQQIVRRSRFNIRPLLGIRPLDSTKGRGYMAWGYVTRYKTTGNDHFKEKAIDCLNWLRENKSRQFDELSWGNHFQFTSRGGRLDKDEPIIVWTSLIGQAFLDAYESFGLEDFLDAAKSIGRWILKLPREYTDRGDCLSYIMKRQSSIHNSNMLGGAFLARLSLFWKDNSALVPVARQAMEYTCSRQEPDGSWFYGEKSHFHWIDNFHTAYNLDSLKCYIRSTGDESFLPHLRKGLDYYVNHFFDSRGRPKYYHDNMFPIDSQCLSQSIETLANFGDEDEAVLNMAIKVARWGIQYMQDKDGYFYFRKYRYLTDRTPMLHWAQATMYRGLCLLRDRLS